MKLLITFAILLNIYGVLAEPHLFGKTPREFQDQSHHFSQPRHKHRPHHHPHHRHHHDDYVNEITVDDLADVILSLPGSLGKQAYRTFLSLGEFLPADTKAHKFFTSIPKAIRRKSNDEISELRALPPVQSAVNPIFMVQPAGYHMMPLPMHPMFSSSPYNYATRVPCRHTKLIHVPLHTFDVQISATTHRFQPAQNSYDDSDDDDDAFDGNAAIKDLLDLINADSDGDVDDENPEHSAPENKGPKDSAPKDNDSKDSAPETNDTDDQALETQSEVTDKEPSTPVEEKSPDESTKTMPEVDDQTPKNQEESPKLDELSPAVEEPAPQTEETSAPSATEDQPLPIDDQLPAAEEVVAPKDESESPKEEIVPPTEEVTEPKEAQSEEPAQNPPVTENSDKKSKKKKGQAKKGKKEAMGPETDSAEVQEPEPAAVPAAEPAPGPVPEEEDSSIGEVTKPIPTKRGRKKRTKGQKAK